MMAEEGKDCQYCEWVCGNQPDDVPEVLKVTGTAETRRRR